LEQNQAERGWPLSTDRNAFMGNLDNQYLLLKLAALFFLQPDKKILNASVAAGATQNDSDLGFFVYARDVHDSFQLYSIVSAAGKFCRTGFSVIPSAAPFFAGFQPAAPGFQQPSFFMALILQ